LAVSVTTQKYTFEIYTAIRLDKILKEKELS